MIKNKLGFTLVEIMVAVAILALLSLMVVNVMTQSQAQDKADLLKIKIFAGTIKNKLARNLIGDWSFFEGTGSSVSDSSDYKNSLTISGASWVTDSSCIEDNCLSFNGSSDYVSLPSNPITLSGDFTISFWFKKLDKSPTDDNDRFIDLTDDANNGLNIITDEAVGKYGVLLKRSGTATINQLTYGNLTLNQWNNLVYVMSGSTGSFYLNGVGITSDGNTTIALAGTGYYFGKRADANSTTFFKGQMDEVMFFDATTSLSQIKQQYLAGLEKLLDGEEITQEDYNQRIGELENSVASK